MKVINWGIIGCGGIAAIFTSSLRALDKGVLLAGASRTAGRAQEFTKKHNIARAYDNYESLVKDPDIDAVYIATTHNFHFENIKLCLEHGKHVLCEKPFTINADQTIEIMAMARDKGLFAMEAVWTRFLPAILKLQELLDSGIIGEVRTVRADFSIDGTEFGPEHRIRNKAIAGGALLDLGIYPITLASIIFGEQPTRIQSSAVIGDTDIDDRSYYLFDYPRGRNAILSSSFTHMTPSEGLISGTKGFIQIPTFLAAKEFHIHLNNKENPESFHLPFGEGENFKFEIDHCMTCIQNGKTESDILPLSETLAVMKTMDCLREQWGLRYEGE